MDVDEEGSRWSCGIPKQSIKLLNRIIACIEKFSEDLILDISEEGMVFRAVNKSRSAFSQFKFAPAFFDSYSAPIGTSCFLIKAKPCLAIFRSYGNINRCSMSLNEIDCRIVFDLECSFGVTKSHLLTYQDTDAIQCNFIKDTLNKVKCFPQCIGDLLGYFHGNNEEVSLIFEKARFILRTYVELDELSKDQVAQLTRTELVMEPNEFKQYILESSGEEIVISLKEVKAICLFAEALGQPISLHFQKPGKPMMFAMKYYSFLECEFILATFGVDEQETSEATTSSSGMASSDSVLRTPCTPSLAPSVNSSPTGASPSISFLCTPNTPPLHPEEGISSTPHGVEAKNNLFVGLMDESDEGE